MTKFEQLLDVLNTHAKTIERATRRKKRFNREDLEKILAVGSAITSAVAVAVPQARPAAAVLVSLQQSATGLPSNKPRLQVVADEEPQVQEKVQ